MLERLVFFSDAVMAIAITLLVIELHPPHLHRGSPDAAYWRALLPMLPELVNFVISFLVIGSFWAGHHRAFGLGERWDDRLLLPNIVFLLTVAAFPFLSGFAAANPGARVPVALYCGWLLLMALFAMRLQHIVTRAPIVDDDATPERIAEVLQRGRSVALGAVTALVVSLIIPVLGQAALVSIPLWRRLLDRRVAPAA